jgi:hypothetical protein
MVRVSLLVLQVSCPCSPLLMGATRCSDTCERTRFRFLVGDQFHYCVLPRQPKCWKFCSLLALVHIQPVFIRGTKSDASLFHALLCTFVAMRLFVCSVAAFLWFADSALAGSYSLSDSVVGSQFYDAFSFQAIADPTEGTVFVLRCPLAMGSDSDAFRLSTRNYVNESTAKSKGLVRTTGNSITLRADDTTRLSAKGPGRDSVRVRSNKSYTTHVAVCVFPILRPYHSCI